MNNCQLAIIGGGPAGYTAAEKAAKAGLSVTLFEKDNLGGVCLNEGCIPTKTLLYSAKMYDSIHKAARYGVEASEAKVDLAKVLSRKTKVVRKLTLGIKARLTQQGVNIVKGEASIVNPHLVKCGEDSYECENLLICTGSHTVIPPIPGLDQVDYWTHREALCCQQVPTSIAIVGGGVIGMEFAAYFCSLGAKVTVVEMMDEILSGTDRELAALLREEYKKRGVLFMTGVKVSQIDPTDEGLITLKGDWAGDDEFTLTTDRLLMSVGRRPNMQGFGLENLGLALTQRGSIAVDEHLQTSQEGIYACGDVNGLSMLAHSAVRQAEVAVNHILGKPDQMSYCAIPSVVYTNPELAGVGETEESLRKKDIPYEVIKLPMALSGRFVAENEGINGLCKVLTDKSGKLLGVHMLGNPASELIAIAGMAIEDGKTIEDWKRYVFPHPTVGEIFREL